MTTTTTASSSPSSAAPAAGAPRGGLPGSPNPTFGAAVLKDIYKAGGHGVDPALERRQARTLGLAFLVFFGGILGGISLSLNGLFPWTQAGRTVVSYRTSEGALPAWLKKDDQGETVIAPGTQFTVDATSAAGPVALTPAVLDRDAPRSLEKYQVRVFVDRHRVGVLELDLDPKTVTTHPSAVSAGGEALPVLPAYKHAWNEAKLAKLVPTRFVMGFGALMGIVALLVPAALVPFYRAWMRWVTAPLGWFNTRLILSIVFFLMLTPMAFVARLLGKGRLELRPRPAGESYWRRREKQRDRAHFERTF